MDNPAEQQPTYCSYHPNRPTSLRCNRCGRPICSQCAIRTPVGYRCKTCVQEQQKIFNTAYWYDFPIAFGVAAVVLGAGSVLADFIGFFSLFIAGFAGSIAVRAVTWAVRHRRNKYLWLAAAAGGVAGCIPVMILPLVGGLLLAGQYGVGGLLGAGASLLWPLAYLVVAVVFLVTGLKGVRFW